MEVFIYYVIKLMRIYRFILIVYALSTWFRPNYDSIFYKIKETLYKLVAPVVSPVESILPGILKMFSVLIAYFIIYFLEVLLITTFF